MEEYDEFGNLIIKEEELDQDAGFVGDFNIPENISNMAPPPIDIIDENPVDPVDLWSHGRRNLDETVEEREARQEAELVAWREQTNQDRYIYNKAGEVVLEGEVFLGANPDMKGSVGDIQNKLNSVVAASITARDKGISAGEISQGIAKQIAKIRKDHNLS